MKLIVAIIQPTKLEVLKRELHNGGIQGMTVTDVHGVGRQRGHKEVYRGQEYEISLVPKVKVEVAVSDGSADRVVQLITNAARSGKEGKIGDGKIFVLPLEDALRIRTGEGGADAV
jgi:nitrogen regulatory protein PII